jgi:hypothetical protein
MSYDLKGTDVTRKTNEVVASLDRTAARLGIDLIERGVNAREFAALGRLIRYRPGGKGVIRVEAFEPSVDGWKLDAVAHRTLEGMEKLLLKSANGPTN